MNNGLKCSIYEGYIKFLQSDWIICCEHEPSISNTNNHSTFFDTFENISMVTKLKSKYTVKLLSRILELQEMVKMESFCGN